MEKEDGKVIIPQEAVDRSNEVKRSHRTLRQLPLYRDMSNLKYMVVRLYDKTPRKYTKYLDCVLNTVTEAKKCVGLGEATRDMAMRAEYLSMARIFIEDLQDDLTILVKMEMISRQTEKAMKNLAKGIVAQCVAWRDYSNDLGAKS